MNKSEKIRQELVNWSWIPCVLAVIMAFISPFLFSSRGLTPVFMVLYVFAIMFGIGRYGWKNLLGFLVIYYVISMFMENMSTMTGFPFGLYSYATGLGARIFNVPAGVGAFYVNMGFFSWSIASILLDGADRKLEKKINVIAMPVVTAFVMTALDLPTDFISSTVQHTWVWPNGGGFFGVPFTNFLGWAFVTWLCAQVFALFLSRQQKKRTVHILEASKKNFVWQALTYGSLGLNLMIAYFAPGKLGTVTDLGGTTWKLIDMREAALLIGFFTIVFFAAFALLKLARGDHEEAESNRGVVKS